MYLLTEKSFVAHLGLQPRTLSFVEICSNASELMGILNKKLKERPLRSWE